MIRVEFDSGGIACKNPHPSAVATPRGRARGFYFNGHKIPISFMRVGEIKAMEKFLNEIIKVGGPRTSEAN